MLTLLPPLIITVHPQVYDEQLHDTNRATWNDKGAVSESSMKLIYYRPILVYGNRLNIAVKGLVGNIEKEIHQPAEKSQQWQDRKSSPLEHLGNSQVYVKEKQGEINNAIQLYTLK